MSNDPRIPGPRPVLKVDEPTEWKVFKNIYPQHDDSPGLASLVEAEPCHP